MVAVLAIGPALPALAADYSTSTFLSNNDAGSGGQAVDAYIDEPRGLDMSSEAIYVVDTVNNVIEKIDQTGVLTTIAGTGNYGLVNGAAAVAEFASPEDIAVFGEQAEQIFIADTGNNEVRKLENNTVASFLTGLSGPKGVEISGDTLFISDTGNNRILGMSRAGGTATAFASGLNQPTKLLFWPEARSIIFVNFGEGSVRAVNVDTGKVTGPLISDLEDIGGIFLEKRNLFVVSSYSIGVFNEIWKVRLGEPDPSGQVQALSTKRLSLQRETEHLNWPTDAVMRENTLAWEEYYTWDPNLIYTEPSAAQKNQLQCLPIRKPGQNHWRKQWYMKIDRQQAVYQQNFILRPSYQGDQVFFRVKLQYDNKKLSEKKRQKSRDKNQSAWKKSIIFANDDLTAPTNLTASQRQASRVTLAWDAVTGANKYQVQLWHNDKRVDTKSNVKNTSATFTTKYVDGNQVYTARVRSCTGGDCSAWSDFYSFRTPPAKPFNVAKVLPARGIRMQALASGKYLATLQFRLRQPNNTINKQLRAKVQLCSKHLHHPDTITTKRLYVLYKGGSALLVWHNDGKLPELFAGKHRFQDDYGSTADALLGRPKDLVLTGDQTTMYIAENNKLAVYDFSSQQLTELAGHVMDSYTEGTGTAARFSDITDIDLSSNGKWLYVVDRNNHRIRKVDTTTGTSHYITGAGGTNFLFESDESNGYQEGGPCADEFEQNVAGCAYFNRPTGIVLSPDDKTLYVAEGSNNRIRAVNVNTGKTSLIAGSGDAGFKNGTGSSAQFNGPYSLDITSDGKTLYVADKYNHAIRKITLSSKVVTTVTGTGSIGHRDGTLSSAVLAIPEYVQEDNGVLYWTEAGTHSIRAAVLSANSVFTISGNGSRGYVDGVGSGAEWNNPKGIDVRGNKLYVADSTNDVVRTIEL